MPLQGLPETATLIGAVEIALYMNEHGHIQTAYGFEGMSKDAAIGHLTVVLDRLREERALEWDTCPGCGLPWSEHGEPEEEQEDDDELHDG